MKLFTYHVSIASHEMSDELKLLNLWREHWANRGFQPCVLNEWIARKHPYFEEFNAAVAKLPTVNSVAYEMACYHRWLALAQVGGGFMADYDVFAARKIQGHEIYDMIGNNRKLNLYQTRNVCPSFVYASAEAALKVCKLFATGKYGLRTYNGRPHASDMLALEDIVNTHPDWIRKLDVVRDFQGSEGWEKAEMVHFSNGSMKPRGFDPRWKHIPEILKSLNQP